MGRKLLWASLVLAPITLLLRFVFDAGETTLFVASALSLVPLAWLIGEATEQAGEHTGPGIGGFLNASFGNAPELIIALFAVNESLPDVVRGSLAGSVVSNILLVLGVALIFGGQGGHGRPLDRFSLLLQLGLVLVATALFLVPSVPGWTGDPERHTPGGADDPGRDRAARPLRHRDPAARSGGTSGCTPRAATRRPRAAGRCRSRWSRSAPRRS